MLRTVPTITDVFGWFFRKFFFLSKPRPLSFSLSMPRYGVATIECIASSASKSIWCFVNGSFCVGPIAVQNSGKVSFDIPFEKIKTYQVEVFEVTNGYTVTVDTPRVHETPIVTFNSVANAASYNLYAKRGDEQKILLDSFTPCPIQDSYCFTASRLDGAGGKIYNLSLSSVSPTGKESTDVFPPCTFFAYSPPRPLDVEYSISNGRMTITFPIVSNQTIRVMARHKNSGKVHEIQPPYDGYDYSQRSYSFGIGLVEDGIYDVYIEQNALYRTPSGAIESFFPNCRSCYSRTIKVEDGNISEYIPDIVSFSATLKSGKIVVDALFTEFRSEGKATIEYRSSSLLPGKEIATRYIYDGMDQLQFVLDPSYAEGYSIIALKLEVGESSSVREIAIPSHSDILPPNIFLAE